MELTGKILEELKKDGIPKGLRVLALTACYRIWKPLYCSWLCRHVPIEKGTVLFYSVPDYSDNCKYLYEYLKQYRQEEENLHFIWLYLDHMPDPAEENPDTEFVAYASRRYRGRRAEALRKIASAEYVFFSHASPFQVVKKREGQKAINLWHGCGYKDIQNREKRWISGEMFDYALVPGPVFVESKARFFGCRKEQLLELGSPRYDLLISGSREEKPALFGSGKLVVWMPTFRRTASGRGGKEEGICYRYDLPLLKSEADLMELDRFCREKKITICVKRHPDQVAYSSEGKNTFTNIVFTDNEALKSMGLELYEFLKMTDALISDYSSTAVDYLLLDRPIAFSLDDFEEYRQTRGFVFDHPLDYMPGHHLYSFGDLKNFLENLCRGEDPYAEERKKLMPALHHPCDNYCARIWNTVKTIGTGSEKV